MRTGCGPYRMHLGGEIKMRVKVSVIVPVYNTERFLSKCLDSLVNQTLEEIEIIVINDGSPDRAQAVINEYARRYPAKIRSFTQKNEGPSEARNQGIRCAVGEFIGFADSDDYVSPDMFERLYERAVKTKAEVVCCSFFRTVGRTETEEILTERDEVFGKSAQESPEALKFARSVVWNKLFKREFWLRGQFRFPKGQYYEDFSIIYGLLLQANKIEYIRTPLYHYLLGRAGAVTSSGDRRAFDSLKACSAVIDSFQGDIGTRGTDGGLSDVMTHICLVHIYWMIYGLARRGVPGLAVEYVDAAFGFLNERMPGWQESSFFRCDESRPLRNVIISLCRSRFLVRAYCGLPLWLRRLVPDYLDGAAR